MAQVNFAKKSIDTFQDIIISLVNDFSDLFPSVFVRDHVTDTNTESINEQEIRHNLLEIIDKIVCSFRSQIIIDRVNQTLGCF